MNFLNKEDVEGLILHVFFCASHPLKSSQKKMSALDWGRLRCHCAVYEKLQEHLDGKNPYPFWDVMPQFKQKNVLLQTQ